MPKSTKRDDTTFYIADEELARLSPAAKKAWAKRLKKETFTAYETPQQIDARMKAVTYDKFPAFKKKLQQHMDALKAGKPSPVTMDDFPQEAMGSFLYSIGASGISFYIDMFLRAPEIQNNAEAMEALAALSRARHKILEKNAAVFA